jgi:hypothetical protein
MNHAGQGKLQTAPLAIREAVCARILNGELTPTILPWLHAQPEMRRHLAERFDGVEVSEKNFSDFRTGYFEKWRRNREQLARQRELSEHALNVVKSSGLHLSEAAAALAAGRLLAAVDKLSEEDAPPEDIVAAIHDLRKGDLKSRELALKAEALEHLKKEFALREENTAWTVAKKILAALQSREMQAVADSDADSTAKMQDIVRIAFGDDLLARMEARRKESP